MEKVKKAENHIPSVSAFHGEGTENAIDDGCSICLESFSQSEPSTVTICKHEFHLQCILEWCERSSNCPMCWQAITLKDHASQELLAAVERERCFEVESIKKLTNSSTSHTLRFSISCNMEVSRQC